jgi:hypothetical protein
MRGNIILLVVSGLLPHFCNGSSGGRLARKWPQENRNYIATDVYILLTVVK